MKDAPRLPLPVPLCAPALPLPLPLPLPRPSCMATGPGNWSGDFTSEATVFAYGCALMSEATG